MIKVTFLGTAGSTPTKYRGLPSVAVDFNGELFLFDCGEGTQRQMMRFSVNISKIKAIFLTHIHGDHSIGIAGLVRTLALNRRTTPLYIFVPHGSEKILHNLINFDNAVINYKIIINPIKVGTVYKGKDFEISAFKLVHTIDTYGFAIKENDKTRFLKPKIRNLKMKGEMFGRLLKKKSIKLGNRTVRLEDVSIRVPGRKIIYVTDTRPTSRTVSAAAGADLLIHESTYADAERELAKERYHSTALESATIAQRAKAKRLVLTHTSARYKDAKVLLIEARKIFKNTEVASDGFVVSL
jgi:ribonuclease Z